MWLFFILHKGTICSKHCIEIALHIVFEIGAVKYSWAGGN